MNLNQKQEIIDIIKGDCKISSMYIDSNNCTCAIGALALAAGVSKTDLIIAGAKSITNEYCDSTITILEATQKKFGLSPNNLREIQIRNDCNNSSFARQERILEYLNNLPITDD